MGGRVEGKIKKKSVKAKVTSKFSSKRKLSRMGKKQKKGHAGPSTEFITRSAVLRQLQITLKDFRRLCILKGVYPRVPTKASKGSDKIYYDIKDISYLAHEPLLAKFREFKTFMRKIRKAAGRNQTSEARRKDRMKPVMILDHLVKERYPRFIDALRDLDDALCMIHLFASLPSVGRITAERTAKCQELSRHWQYYIAKSKTLRKVFVSVKGVYFQAEIMGEPVTWLTPHQFTQEIPREVDLRVMLTFLEFYEVYLKFVLFKLFHLLQVKYPPVVDKTLNDAGCCLLALKVTPLDKPTDGATIEDAAPVSVPAPVASSSLSNPLLNAKSHKKVSISKEKLDSLKEKLQEMEGDEDEEENSDDEGDVEVAGPLADAFAAIHGEADGAFDGVDETFSSLDKEGRAGDSLHSHLFHKLKFFVNREVPLDWMQLCILAHGGLVGWEGELSPYPSTDPSITHHVMDRPVQGASTASSREYVQPQWVFDSINAQVLLPVHLYRVGSKLPPHLSPFVDDEKEGYIPRFREEVRQLQAASGIATTSSSSSSSTAKDQEELLDSGDDESHASSGEEESYAAGIRAEKKIGKTIQQQKQAAGSAKAKGKKDKKKGSAGSARDEEEDEEFRPQFVQQKASSGFQKGPKAVVFTPEVPVVSEDQEAADLSKVMMGKKTKRLYDRMQHGIAKKQEVVQGLEEKRKLVESQAAVEAVVQPKLKKQKAIEGSSSSSSSSPSLQGAKKTKKGGR